MSDDADTGRTHPELTDHRRVVLPAEEMGAETIAQVDLSVEGYNLEEVMRLHDAIISAIEEEVGAEAMDRKRGGLK